MFVCIHACVCDLVYSFRCQTSSWSCLEWSRWLTQRGSVNWLGTARWPLKTFVRWSPPSARVALLITRSSHWPGNIYSRTLVWKYQYRAQGARVHQQGAQDRQQGAQNCQLGAQAKITVPPPPNLYFNHWLGPRWWWWWIIHRRHHSRWWWWL